MYIHTYIHTYVYIHTYIHTFIHTYIHTHTHTHIVCNLFYRKEVAGSLLKFGAQPGMRNGQNESVVDIVQKHPQHRQEDFMKLFRGIMIIILILVWSFIIFRVPWTKTKGGQSK